jgi:peptide/nickel transport system substrate-binding protein
MVDVDKTRNEQLTGGKAMKKQTLWLGISVVLVVALGLSSCGPTAAAPTAAAPTAAAPTAAAPTAAAPTAAAPTAAAPIEPKPEGTVTIAHINLAEEGFLPWVGSANETLWEVIYEYLIYLKNDGTPVGGLAERWETSADALAVTVWLRQGIPWQDGWGEVTAEDVKYTFERNMDEDSTNTRASFFRDSVASIEVIDPYAVVFHLKAPNPAFWVYLTDVGSATMPIVCREYIEAVGEAEAMEHGIGSGPYRLVKHVFGDRFEFEALTEHWRVVPEFQHLILKVVPEETTRVAMLTTGAADVAPITPGSISVVEEAGLRFFIMPGTNSYSMVLGGNLDPQDDRYQEGYHQQDPWADIRVREAMNLAIDREAIIEAVFFGAAVPISIKMPLHGWEDLEPIPYDPERAKELLAEAGYPDGFSFEVMSCGEEAELPKLVEAVAGYWENIGLAPTIVPVDWATYKANNVITGMTAGQVFPHGTSTKPDYMGSASLNFRINGGQPSFQSQEIEALFERLDAALDWDETAKIWVEMSEFMRDNYTTVPIAYGATVWAFGEKVEDISPVRGQTSNIVYLRHAEPLNTFRLFELDE